MREQERTRPPSIRDVADRAGVSYQTVSRVLNDHPRIREETARRVNEAIGALGYRPNRAARALVTQRTHSIGVLVPARALYGPFSSFVAIVDAARERGYAVETTPVSSERPEDLVACLDLLLGHGVEGVVAIAPQDRARETVRRSGTRVPVITLQGGPDEIEDFGFDQREGARAAVRHLVELGHRRILHLPGPAGWAEADERQRGYLEEVAAHGLEPMVAEAGDWTADSGYGIGAAALRAMAPTAVFAANDEMAFGVLAAARDHGVAVPEDLSVVGFDDAPIARFTGPGLTTLRQDFAELGRRAIGLLLDEIEGDFTHRPDRILPDLVVRGSTAHVTDRTRHAAEGCRSPRVQPYDATGGVNVSYRTTTASSNTQRPG